jgi:hypothetical protein
MIETAVFFILLAVLAQSWQLEAAVERLEAIRDELRRRNSD